MQKHLVRPLAWSGSPFGSSNYIAAERVNCWCGWPLVITSHNNHERGHHRLRYLVLFTGNSGAQALLRVLCQVVLLTRFFYSHAVWCPCKGSAAQMMPKQSCHLVTKAVNTYQTLATLGNKTSGTNGVQAWMCQTQLGKMSKIGIFCIRTNPSSAWIRLSKLLGRAPLETPL
jgi:hypothetical protein